MPRPDFSDYVAHFTKNTPPFAIKEHAEDEAIKAIQGDAYQRLVSILESKRILATPMPWTNRTAVAFTECPWGSLLDHTKQVLCLRRRFQKGEAFRRRWWPSNFYDPTFMRTSRTSNPRKSRIGKDSILNSTRLSHPSARPMRRKATWTNTG